MSKEVVDILKKNEDKILISPFEKENDDVIVDGQSFSHQDLLLDIY